jgi:penicillin V acylase-like amidase (Ntn superfamily)
MCTRALWSSGGDPGKGIVVVGRNMDWFEDTQTDLWALPRGIERNGMATGDTVRWKARYGSVVASMYGAMTTDGMNEKGLTVNGLYLAETDYGERDDSRPGLAMTISLQFFLDSFATVTDLVEWTLGSGVQICPSLLGSSGKPGTGHISAADATGDSAIIEFIEGQARIYHGREYAVMTNSPPFDEQLRRLERFTGFGGDEPLPGTTDAADRFVRAAYYTAHLPSTNEARLAIASMMSVMRNASAPFGTADPARPNVSTTRWRTVADLTHRTYFFESTVSPNVIWLRLDNLDLGKGAKVRKLDLVDHPDRVGDVTRSFRPARPFRFLPPGGTAS